MDPIKKMHQDIAAVKYRKLEPTKEAEVVEIIRRILTLDLLLRVEYRGLPQEEREEKLESSGAEKAMLEDRKAELESADASVSQQFITKFAALRNQTELCDFTITCGSKVWRVHKLILQLHSPVLGRMGQAFQMLEGQQSKLDLSADPEEVIAALVDYLYAMEYESDTKKTGELALHTQVFIFADKYDMPDLMKLALSKFNNTLKTCSRPYAFDLKLENESVTAACELTQGDFEDVAKKIRRMIIDHVAAHPECFYTGKSKNSAFAQLMADDEGLTALIDWRSMDYYDMTKPAEAQGPQPWW